MPNHKRPIQNAREPLPMHNSDARLAPVTAWLNSEWGRMEEATGFPWDTGDAAAILQLVDSLTAGREFADSIGQPEQAEVPMTDTPPMDQRVQQLVDEVLCTGTALALAQSMKVLGQQAADEGREGWAVIARRAEQFVRAMHMHVTRLLKLPDCRLSHPSMDVDLLAAHVDVADVGRVMVHCTDTDGKGWHPFPLEELVLAGPMDDAVRIMVQELTRTLVQEQIGQAAAAGALPGFDTFNNALAEARKQGDTLHAPFGPGGTGVQYLGVDEGKPGGDHTAHVEASLNDDGSLTVHHLSVHPEYVLGEDGPHTERGDDWADRVG